MRVLTVARWYPSHDSRGRGSFVADLVAATSRAGVDTRVVSFDRVLVRGRLEARGHVLLDARTAYERAATPEALFVVPASWGAPGVPVARLPMVRRPGADDPLEELEDHAAALGPFVRRLAETWRPDVLHAHTGLPDGIVAADLGASLGIPVVVSEHMSTIEAELANPTALERYRSLLRPGVTLLAVSASLAERVAGLLAVPSDRIGVLPNPVNADDFHLAEDTRDPDELLWIGSLGEHKGIEVMLRAFAAIHGRRPGLHLRLIGSERLAGELDRWRALASELSVGDALAFEGWADRAAVSMAMRRAGVFVHPSPSETFGVVAAEAILSGLPVVARQSGGVPGIIERAGGFGRVASDDSVEALAAAIEGALDGRFDVDAKAARRRLVEWLDAPEVARQALAVYESVLADGERGESSQAASRVDNPHQPLPRLLVATGWDAGWHLVAQLPDRLRADVSVVLPARPDGATERPSSNWVEALPVPPPTRPPSGRSPLTKIRRLLYRPPPTGDELLGQAIVGAARGVPGRGRGPVQVVALDAPAAVLIDELGGKGFLLAPGALRWLADLWDAQRAARR